MTNIPYEERIKNRSNDWYYNKCIRQYHFIIKSEGANERYKEEIKRLTKAKETMENEYDDLLKAFSKSTTEYKKEIARLNKIIDELEKYLITKRDLNYELENPKKNKLKPYEIEKELYHNNYCRYYEILDKLKELKEEGKK